jgi:hypothetical protein
MQEIGINLNAINPKKKNKVFKGKCYPCQITFITLQI